MTIHTVDVDFVDNIPIGPISVSKRWEVLARNICVQCFTDPELYKLANIECIDTAWNNYAQRVAICRFYFWREDENK